MGPPVFFCSGISRQQNPGGRIAPTSAREGRTSTKILVVEDSDDLAFGLRRTLESHGYVVEVAGDGVAALRLARTFSPDLVMLDLMLPLADGYTVLSRLREEGLHMPVLILSAKGEEADKVRGFQVGADDYVTKPFGVLELLARVAALLRRAARRRNERLASELASRPLTFQDLTIDTAGRRVVRRGDVVPMTPKEFDLLVFLARQPGEALSRKTLLREVWGHAPDVQTRTVDIHIVELRKKLEDRPTRPRHIVTVWKTGYRFDP